MSSSRLVVVIIAISGVDACVRDTRVTREWRASGARETIRHDDAMRCDMPPRPRLRVPSAPPRALRASSPSAPSAPSAPSRPSRLHGPAAPRRNVGKLFIKKRTNFACVALRQEQAKKYLQNSVLSHFCFWLRRNAAFHHTSHPTPNAETTAFREIRCFPNLARTCGVLGGDNSLNKQKRRKIYSCVWQKRRVHSKAGIPRSSARSFILRISLESPL